MTLNPTRAHLLEVFGLDLKIVHGAGALVRDVEGREYTDFLSQYGALPFGHNPPEIWEEILRFQASGMPVMMQPLRALEAERLAERLAQITPGDLGVVMLANSGAEAVEAAIKLARARTGKDRILSTRNGFHGKTMGALSATGKPMYQRDFGGPANGFDHIPFGDLDALEAYLSIHEKSVAAFIVEPIQGEGGVIIPPDGYLDGVIATCRRHGVLSVIDEIQTGLGRTGRLFGTSECLETPDMMLLGKALGGGVMPISACVVRPDIWDDRFGSLHSSTFANSNLACTAANATLDRLFRGGDAMIKAVADNGEYFLSRLNELKSRFPGVVRDVRGRGYMAAIEFHKPIERADSGVMAFCALNGGFIGLMSSYLLNVEGLLTAPVFNDAHVMRLQPPLIAERADIDHCIAALGRLCHILAEGRYSTLMRHLVSSERRADLAAAEHLAPQHGPSRADQSAKNRFCFLIHYTEEDDIHRSDPSLAEYDDAERAAWLQWVKQVGPGFAWPVPESRSRTGASIEGMIMSVPLLPADMTGKGRLTARRMIAQAADMALDYGASRFGLGAFTSIVTSGGMTVTGRGVPVTSGNTLTTVSAVKAIERAAERVGLEMSGAHVVVVGATGAIGRLASLMLARQAGRLTLVGNARNINARKMLGRVADDVVRALRTTAPSMSTGDLHERVTVLMAGSRSEPCTSPFEAFTHASHLRGMQAPIAFTTDLGQALEEADIVLVATSADVTLVDPLSLRPGMIVCDVARPPNVSKADLSDHPVLVFDGGLVRPPFDLDLGPFRTLPGNLSWGCLGETMLLALEGETADYSIGRDLSLDEADRIAEMAARHGFEPAPAQWYGSLVREESFINVARAIREADTPAPVTARLRTAAAVA